MKYYKQIDGGYIASIGKGNGGTEISESEYSEILDVIRNKPADTDTVSYRLKVDLTWEPTSIEPVEIEPTSDEILNIILGGDNA